MRSPSVRSTEIYVCTSILQKKRRRGVARRAGVAAGSLVGGNPSVRLLFSSSSVKCGSLSPLVFPQMKFYD
jgi:hypothetical protein